MARAHPLEKTIVSAICAEARRLGWWVMKTHGGQFGSAVGIPDLLAIRGGMAVWMEAKRPGQKVTPIQMRRIDELKTAGCRVAVVTSVREATDFLSSAVSS
jgi:Holliday junction resolvase